ncbi:WbqC family protein [Phytoactinopolyspora alkaliphila]|uniref:WbqC family protein n=1 Tax=Phytoactinopolyspora alkaliphila TaxID=1783498 RepID=A0A6N9YU02_9ACTN|nr:WbqC family protein [Phytoactinopolyspora alkaliphila]NED98523.1 WbqC family protein [Phytoactinopolyspora alkaliphila]
MDDVTVSVHQPNFLPWIKLLDKILGSDVYVVYDTVQYTKSEYHARQRVKTHTGTVWLSVPVLHVRGAHQLLKDVRIDNSQPFRRRHLKVLGMSYGSAPYFDEVFPVLQDVYAREHERLVDLNTDLIEAICSYLGAEVLMIRAGSVPHGGDKTERLVQLVENVGGTDHLTSTFGAGHQEVDWQRFRRAGIGVRAQCFEHPEYPQIGRGFTAGLAAIDMLFACGRNTLDILDRRRRSQQVGPENEPRR